MLPHFPADFLHGALLEYSYSGTSAMSGQIMEIFNDTKWKSCCCIVCRLDDLQVKL